MRDRGVLTSIGCESVAFLASNRSERADWADIQLTQTAFSLASDRGVSHGYVVDDESFRDWFLV